MTSEIVQSLVNILFCFLNYENVFNTVKKNIFISRMSTEMSLVLWMVKFQCRWSYSIHVQNYFKGFKGLWKLKYTIVNWHLQSRRPQSCHVQSRAGHRKRPRGHLWRRGQPARGPLAPLSVWTTALWAGHGLSVRDHTLIHTTAAATATRYPR